MSNNLLAQPIKIEHDKIIGKCEYFIIFKNFSRRNPNEERYTFV